MHPETFPESNTTFTKPGNMTDEQCTSLSAWRGMTDDGYAVVITHWKPSYEDLQALNAGGGIYVMVFAGGQLPPMSLFTEPPFTQKEAE